MNKNRHKIKKKCQTCKNVFIVKTNAYKRAKYCSTHCRNVAYYKKKGAKAQRDYLDKRRIKKYGIKHLKQCLICGKWYRQVGSHVYWSHKMTAREYKEMFGFDVGSTKHTLADDLQKLKKEYVFENDTYKNLEKGIKFRYKKGDITIGRYKRSAETLKRLKVLHTFSKKYQKKCKKKGANLS